MVKTWAKRLYMAFIFLLLYLPIIVLIVLSFNKSKARVTWRGFTLQWYANLFENSRIVDAFTTTLALVYSGEAPYATEYNEDLAYVVPKEGSNVWVDSWAITKDCKNTENAEKFLNYLLEVEISKISFEYNHYGTPNKKLAEILPAKYTEDPALFPPSDVLDNCEIFKSLDQGTQNYYSKLWKEIKLD